MIYSVKKPIIPISKVFRHRWPSANTPMFRPSYFRSSISCENTVGPRGSILLKFYCKDMYLTSQGCSFRGAEVVGIRRLPSPLLLGKIITLFICVRWECRIFENNPLYELINFKQVWFIKKWICPSNHDWKGNAQLVSNFYLNIWYFPKPLLQNRPMTRNSTSSPESHFVSSAPAGESHYIVGRSSTPLITKRETFSSTNLRCSSQPTLRTVSAPFLIQQTSTQFTPTTQNGNTHTSATQTPKFRNSIRDSSHILPVHYPRPSPIASSIIMENVPITSKEKMRLRETRKQLIFTIAELHSSELMYDAGLQRLEFVLVGLKCCEAKKAWSSFQPVSEVLLSIRKRHTQFIQPMISEVYAKVNLGE